MKKLLIMLVGLLLIVPMAGCQSKEANVENLNDDVTGAVEEINPVVSYDTIDEAAKHVDFDIHVLPFILEGYELDSIAVIDNEILELSYKNGSQSFVYRQSKKMDNNSGDYTTYSQVNNEMIMDMTVEMSGENHMVYLAKWTKDGNSFSILVKGEGLDAFDISDMIAGEEVSVIDLSGGMEIPNPMVSYDTIEEASKHVDFEVITSNQIPEGYVLDAVFVISDEILELVYVNGTDQLIFRQGYPMENISGDYTVYSNESVDKVDEMDVTFKGEAKHELALWSNNGLDYSLSVVMGNKTISNEMLVNFIKGL